MTYEIPKTESGKIPFAVMSLEFCAPDDIRAAMRLTECFEAIYANARAEERGRCIDACEDERALAGEGTDGAYRLDRAILAIRNMGDER